MSQWINAGKFEGFKCIVTHAEDKGKYGEIRFTTSRKDKATGKYIKSYFSFWRMVGNGFHGFDKLMKRLEDAPTFADSKKKMGVMIVVKTFSIAQEQFPDKKTGEITFSKQPSFAIFDWDFVEPSKGESIDTPPIVVDEDEEETPDWN